MSNITSRLAAIYNRLQHACGRANRESSEITLVAVSKRQPGEAVREAFDAGQTAFGENYLQEAIDKQRDVGSLPISWHFIGPVQSNKTAAVAEHFDWVHTIDRLKIAERLARDREASGLDTPLSCCIQVNVSGEASKSGIAPSEVDELARAMVELPGLRLRGLMALPEPADDEAQQRVPLAHLRTIQETLRSERLRLDTLSMGMSADLEAAILEGASTLRIGTDVFGPRA